LKEAKASLDSSTNEGKASDEDLPNAFSQKSNMSSIKNILNKIRKESYHQLSNEDEKTNFKLVETKKSTNL